MNQLKGMVVKNMLNKSWKYEKILYLGSTLVVSDWWL